jgi:hypothetical protein
MRILLFAMLVGAMALVGCTTNSGTSDNAAHDSNGAHSSVGPDGTGAANPSAVNPLDPQSDNALLKK